MYMYMYTVHTAPTNVVDGAIGTAEEEKGGCHVIAADWLHLLKLPVFLYRLPDGHLPRVANGNQLHTNEEKTID